METALTVPASREELCELRAGDYVYITGTIYTARDAAHKRLYESLTQGGGHPHFTGWNVSLLPRADSRKRGPGDRFRRPDHLQPHG